VRPHEVSKMEEKEAAARCNDMPCDGQHAGDAIVHDEPPVVSDPLDLARVVRLVVLKHRP
jgi:hypothetical protein